MSRSRSILSSRAGAALAACLLALSLATAASASTPVSLTITGGALEITVPAGPVVLGTIVNTVEGGTVAGPLGVVQVSDARSAAAGSGWVATAISTAFTPPAGPTIAASLVGYTAGAITKVGTATFTATNRTDLTGAIAVVTATGITGDNSASWNPTITVTVPGGMASAVYSATITHSVS